MTTTAKTPVIPPHIWEQDQHVWKAWIMSIDVEFRTKQQYKKSITDFYCLLELPIKQASEQHVNDYEAYLLETSSPATVKRHMSPIRNYWRFAQTYTPTEEGATA